MKLEKGMNFDVVEALEHNVDITKGRHYCVRGEDNRLYDDVGEWFFTIPWERKPIGRLIIKEVKNG